MNVKLLGDIAELAVSADLAKRGYRIAIPFGDNWDFDLLLYRAIPGQWSMMPERIQVKYTESNGNHIDVRCVTQSITNGRKISSKKYTPDMVDWLAAYDKTTDQCYYIPADMLGSNGRSGIRLRLTPTGNNQSEGIRWAKDYTEI